MGRAFQDAIGLLTGKGQSFDPPAGARMLEDLAREGDACAAERLAIVCAAGFGRPQDWGASLDWLALAAEKGVKAAQDQLRLLTQSEAAGDWMAVARSVDIAGWTRSRAKRALVGAPRIEVSGGFLDEASCAWIIAHAGPLEAPAPVYNPASSAAMQHDIRSNTAELFTIANLDLPALLIRARIADTLGVPVLNLERFNVLHYLPGQRFANHVDFLEPSMFEREIAERGQRVTTFLVYLNQDFEEGETSFPRIQKAFKGRTGDAVFFRNVDAHGQPDPLTLLEGRGPSKGGKWV